MLDNRYALLFIRGERPVQDFKYNILKHPNLKLTTDGGAEPYQHGQDSRSIAAIRSGPDLLKQAEKADTAVTHDFLLLDGEELEELFLRLKEKKRHEQQQKEGKPSAHAQ